MIDLPGTVGGRGRPTPALVIESRPMSESLCAETIRISGHDDDEIEAYIARPTSDDSRGGVVVIHHMPGYDRATKEITRRFAELGYDAICPNLYWRQLRAPPRMTRPRRRGRRAEFPTPSWSATSAARRNGSVRRRAPIRRWA